MSHPYFTLSPQLIHLVCPSVDGILSWAWLQIVLEFQLHVFVLFSAEGAFEERCIFIEHICANNRSNILKGVNRRTPYLRVVRCFFVVHNMPGPRTEFPALRMTYRTFTPGQAHAAANDGSPAYENMRLMLDRINQWLQITGRINRLKEDLVTIAAQTAQQPVL